LPEPPGFPPAVEGLPLVPEPATNGGGGMMFDAPRDDPGSLPEAEVEAPTEGGGGTTLAVSEPPGAPAWARAVPEVFPEETVGGGGTMLLVSAPADPFAGLRTVAEETLGGGGTTSCVPKSLPIMPLTNDPLLA
jgi:hypothetical protein